MQKAVSFPEIPLQKLRWRCDPESLPFETTDELTPLEEIIGQERAQKALALGVELVKPGYNIYVCGRTGTGKTTVVQRMLAARQGNGTRPPDLCYVFHFKYPERPRLLVLAPGQGQILKKAMEALLSDLKQEIPRALASVNFRQRKKACLRQAQRREEKLIKRFEAKLVPHFGLLWHDTAPSSEPELALLIDGKPTALSEFEARLKKREKFLWSGINGCAPSRPLSAQILSTSLPTCNGYARKRRRTYGHWSEPTYGPLSTRR